MVIGETWNRFKADQVFKELKEGTITSYEIEFE